MQVFNRNVSGRGLTVFGFELFLISGSMVLAATLHDSGEPTSAMAWKIALVSEAFGASRGVGKELMYWFQGTRVDMMLAWGASFMLLMVAIDVLILRTWEKRVFSWRPALAA